MLDSIVTFANSLTTQGAIVFIALCFFFLCALVGVLYLFIYLFVFRTVRKAFIRYR